MREEQCGVLLRLRAAIQMPVEQRQNPARRLEQLVALRAYLVAAGHQARDHRFAEDKFLAGKAISTHGRMKRRHKQRSRDALAADIAYSNADASLSPPARAIRT